MSRKTRYIVYVDKERMNDPFALFSATFGHFLKKDEVCQRNGKASPVGSAERKLFMAQFSKAYNDEKRMEVIDNWVQIRDAATFPYRKEKVEDIGEAGIRGAESGAALRKGIDAIAKSGVEVDEAMDVIKEVADATKVTSEEASAALTPDTEEKKE